MVHFFKYRESDMAWYREQMQAMANFDPVFEDMWAKLTHPSTTSTESERTRLMLADKARDNGNEWLADFILKKTTTKRKLSFPEREARQRKAM
jgi:hypothetical protein